MRASVAPEVEPELGRPVEVEGQFGGLAQVEAESARPEVVGPKSEEPED
jgi:hypothetical protein